MSPDVKYELESKVAAFAAASGADKGSVVGNLAKLILEILEKSAGIDAEKMVSFCGELYDKYIAPLDLPGIPDAMEVMVDKVLKSTLESIIRKALSDLRAV
jgi:hypothetical protein